MPPSYTLALLVAAAIIVWQAIYIGLLTKLVKKTEAWANAAAQSSKSAQVVATKANTLVENVDRTYHVITEQNDALLALCKINADRISALEK